MLVAPCLQLRQELKYSHEREVSNLEQVDYSIPQFFSDYLYSYNKTTRDFDLQTVDSSELYSTKFINKYTKFSCHDEFFNSSPFAKKNKC